MNIESFSRRVKLPSFLMTCKMRELSPLALTFVQRSANKCDWCSANESELLATYVCSEHCPMHYVGSIHIKCYGHFYDLYLATLTAITWQKIKFVQLHRDLRGLIGKILVMVTLPTAVYEYIRCHHIDALTEEAQTN